MIDLQRREIRTDFGLTNRLQKPKPHPSVALLLSRIFQSLQTLDWKQISLPFKLQISRKIGHFLTRLHFQKHPLVSFDLVLQREKFPLLFSCSRELARVLLELLKLLLGATSLVQGPASSHGDNVANPYIPETGARTQTSSGGASQSDCTLGCNGDSPGR